MRRLRRSGRERAFDDPARPRRRRRWSTGCTTPRRWTALRGWGGVPGHLRQSWGPGWALVGDAGYFKDPITTHGMTDALRDAELLADRGPRRCCGGVREAIALAAYQTDPRRASRPASSTPPRRSRATTGTACARPGAAAHGELGDERRGRPPPGAAGSSTCGPGIAAFIPTDNVESGWLAWVRSERTVRRDDHASAARWLRRHRATASRSCPSSGRAVRPRRWSRCWPWRPGRRLHREQVIEALWPGASVEAAGPRLHKAAHYARRALGGDGSAVAAPQRHGRAAARRRRQHRRRRVPAPRPSRRSRPARRRPRTAALAAYGGQLLPEDVYEPWADEARESLRSLHLDLLRRAERWDDVLAEDPTDEAAHLALIREHVDRGDVRGALRQFERLDHALLRELGTTPSPEAERLRAAAAAPSAGRAEQPTATPGRPAGRSTRGRRPDPRRDGPRRRRPRGTTLLFSGPPGVGKTAVLGLAEALARQRDWRTGRGTASAVEGPWPYAPVLEAFGELCRKHPALLDGLDDRYRHRDRAGALRSGRQLDRRVQPPAAVRRRGRADAPGRRPATGCCSWSTTSRTPTRRRCACCTTSRAAP